MEEPLSMTIYNIDDPDQHIRIKYEPVETEG